MLEPYVEWLGQSNKSVDDILPLKPVGRPKSERNEASEWVKQFLSKGPKPSTEVEAAGEAAGFNYRTLERVKDQPDSFVEAFRKDGKWFWKLDPFAVFPEGEGGEQDPEGQQCQNL